MPNILVDRTAKAKMNLIYNFKSVLLWSLRLILMFLNVTVHTEIFNLNNTSHKLPHCSSSL